MTGSDGGNSSPSDPAAVTRPTEKSSGYPSSRSDGRRSPPSARIVTPDAPVKVVNRAHTNVAITATPPGIQPKSPL